MTTLTAAQIAKVAHGAGFRGDGLVSAVEVALAESGGATRVVNTNPDRWHSRDRGVWQINDHWHPEVSDAQAFDPAGCARAAFAISHGGTDWSAWSTWPTAAKAQFVYALSGIANAGLTAEAGIKDNGLKQSNNFGEALVNDPKFILGHAIKDSPLSAIAGGLLSFGSWVADPHNWLRVALVVGGSGAVVMGLNMLAKSGAAGPAVAEAAALPGKAVKAATNVGAAVATGGASVAAKAVK